MEEKRKYLEYFDGAFDSTVAEKRQPENWPYVAYSKTDGVVVYTVVPKIEGVYYDVTELVKKSIPVPSTGYGEVDLGLPSGLKWADRNVGAETPQDNGAYFSWGSTTNAVCLVDGGGVPQDELIKAYLYDNDGYSYDDMTPELIQGVKDQYGDNLESELKNYFNESYGADTWGIITNYLFIESNAPYYEVETGTYTKYNKTDGLTTLDSMDDTATVNMGSDWRMPTSAETLELVQNTDHYYIGEDGSIVAGPFDYGTSSSDKGLDGSKLRSICFVKKDATFNYNNRSNFIEFPFAGECFGSLLGFEGLSGVVWSSSVGVGDVLSAHVLYFNSDGDLGGGDSSGRYYGQSVRGVHA